MTATHGHAPTANSSLDRSEPVATRVLDAALACIARFGVAKTTVDDVAREAGVSRATLYRAFPGKQPLLAAVVEREVERLEVLLRDAADSAGATELDELLTELVVEGVRHLEHHAALMNVLAHEPDVVLPALTFDGAGVTLARGGRMLAPLLARFVGADRAERAGEWVARVVLAYACAPNDLVTLTDPDSVRAFVRELLVPSLVPSDSPARCAVSITEG